VSRYYRVLPWELDAVGELDLLQEAEDLDMEDELREIAYDRARRKAEHEAERKRKRGKTAMPGTPAGYELETAEDDA